MPAATRRLLLEAVCTSAYVRATLSFLPFKKVAGWLGKHNEINNTELKDVMPVVKKVRFVIELCDKYTPWTTECYTRALTGKIMLQRRNISSTLYLGFKREENKQLEGHAWLQCSGVTVTGFCDFSKFQVHSYFT